MQSNELRVGNWVNNNEEDYQITSATIAQLERGDSTAKPILITEEWLLRLGFEQIYKSSMHSTYWIENLTYYFWYPYVSTEKKNSQYADFKGIRLNNCLYLHQLQNLYYAINGIELSVNPKK